MKKFTYQARDSQGKHVKAQIEAENEKAAAVLLMERGMFPLTVDPADKASFGGDINAWLERFQKVRPKDRVLFTRQLATLVKSGLPIARALEMLQGQIENPKMQELVRQIHVKVQGGQTLAQSLAVHPEVFTEVYISMVEAGEVSGNLEETLLRLATQEEKTQAINSKIKSALTYPVVVLVVLLAVSILMLTMVLPQVGNMYIELKQPLPFFTNLLLALSDIMRTYWYMLLLLTGGGIYGLRVFVKSPQGEELLDKLKLRIPVLNVLMKKIYAARFSRTMSSLVSSGMPILQSLTVMEHAISNSLLERSIRKIGDRVKAGDNISKPINEDPLFLPLLGQMLAVGEQTGSVGESLGKVADYYEEEVDEAIKNIQTLIEPATMVLLGGMVAFLIAAVLLPIYGLVSNIR